MENGLLRHFEEDQVMAINNPFGSGISQLKKNSESVFNKDPSDIPKTMLALDDIIIRVQAREEFEDADTPLSELAESIEKKSVQNPIWVWGKDDGTYILIAGERRCRASRMAGKAKIPALIYRFPGLSEEEAESEVRGLQWIENNHRKNFTQFEEAKALKGALEKLGSPDAVAKERGISRAKLTKMLALLDLPPQTAEFVMSGGTSDAEVIYQSAAIERKSSEKAKEVITALKENAQKDKPAPARKVVSEIKNKDKPTKKDKQDKPEAYQVDTQTKDMFQAKGKSSKGSNLLDAMAANDDAEAEETGFEDPWGTDAAVSNAATLTEVKNDSVNEVLIREWFDKGHHEQHTAAVVLKGLKDGTFAPDGIGSYRLVAFLAGADATSSDDFSYKKITQMV